MPFKRKKIRKRLVSLLNLHRSSFFFSAFKLIFFLLVCEEPDEYFDSMPKSEMAPAAEKLSGQEICDNILISDKENLKIFIPLLFTVYEYVYIYMCVCVSL